MPETPDPHGGGGIDPRIIDTEFMPALENLELFKASGIGPASAVNEHGSVQGLVTLINALEGPVGDLLPSISGICLGPSSARTDPGCLGALPPPSWIGSRQRATTSKGDRIGFEIIEMDEDLYGQACRSAPGKGDRISLT